MMELCVKTKNNASYLADTIRLTCQLHN